MYSHQISTHSLLPPPPPNTTQKPAHTNTFVHKLYNMVVDSYYQHLISWAYAGSSFIVCNIMEFSRDVLPKHFKHNNFSSFVRQLNMYGFHKVNKSPRGHRTLAENQIWEFSHPKFLRNRPDLLDDIKRKSMESDPSRRESDLQHHVNMLQASQSEMIQQIQHLYDNFSQVMKELEQTKQKQESQSELIKTMMNYITQQHGDPFPHEQPKEKPPSIFVTSHENNTILQDIFRPLTVQTQNLSPCGNTLPPSPSPSMLVSDDELDNSLYSPNSPHTPRHTNHHLSSYMSYR
ncbi:HSF-type DNA-binding-domain-containing protein [Gilbertella persicaria]|uniref:HSF-type DNA-binding domain-containing protein n=1 Tax=Rhizopus stolonifer TaxID=4846 RepID=A0A367KVD6_RHIST|nr:HSF-type DNA-binding-domain-containing protein [Gilbertella persicaria]KAI8073467.1 HSF-type DNA-binding-domain-containing protein [Gilbertella persicaria]RCI06169.1 hypothetical protein CU098_013543 [Rhizopus stolonifer]